MYGVRPVAEALRAGRRHPIHLWVREGRGGRELERIRARARSLGVPVETASEAALRERAGADAHTQGVLLEAGPLPCLGLEALLAGAAGAGPRLLVALDGVEDPRNLGAIARVAEAAGAAGLVLTERRSPPLGPVVARASAGAIESLPLARVGNLPQALETLKTQGFWVFGGEAEAGEDLFALPDRVFRGDAVVVLGAEGRGLRPGVRRRLDHVLRIPLRGRVASLNVATAAAVILFEWVRRAEARGGRSGSGAE